MKKLYFSSLLLLGAIAGSQAQQNMTFEPGGQGANYTWNVFENDTNPPLEFVANPNPSGINTSATVAKFTVPATGNPWAGTETVHGQIGTFVLDAAHATVKIMVYKSVISDVGLKLVPPGGTGMTEIKIPNTVVNQWEELTFNLSVAIGQTIDQIVIFPDYSPIPRTYGAISYFDNITFTSGSALPQPSVAAPTPTMAAANVISLFSGAYTNVPVDTWLAVWSQSAYQEVPIQGNATKKYSGLNYAGVETIASQINITGMTHFNLDVWSADFTQFRVKLVDFGANAVYGGGDDTEHELTYTAPAQGQWISYHIPISDFVNLQNKQHIAQLIFSSNGTSTVFIDNIYFSNNATAGTESFETAKLKLYPNPANNVLNLEAAAEIQKVMVYNNLGQQVLESVPNASSVALNLDKLQAGIYILGVEVNGTTTTKKFIKH